MISFHYRDGEHLEECLDFDSLARACLIRVEWPDGVVSIGSSGGRDDLACLALGRKGEPPSMAFYVDPQSGQPMVRLRSTSPNPDDKDGPPLASYKSYPLDKIIRNPMGK